MTRVIFSLILVTLIVSCGGEAKYDMGDGAKFIKDSLRHDSIARDMKERDSIKTVNTELVTEAGSSLPDKFINPVDGSEMIKIPAGEFVYGITKNKRNNILKEMKSEQESLFDLESPEMKVPLTAYFIDKFEITNEQFLKFVTETGHPLPKDWTKEMAEKNPRYPATNLGWKDARTYAIWAGKRIPSEQEWEKAARGRDGRIWPWGNDPDGNKYNGSFQSNYRPMDVGSFPAGASPYGVMDMAGNVYEMTTGKWEDGYAMRGGSYLNGGSYTRTMFRWSPNDTINGASWLGFRCVMDSVEVVKMLNRSKD